MLNLANNWDACYDVAVLGFGGAGATAARFAADKGAKVLLVDSAPEGQEGGNTRFCGQSANMAEDFDSMKTYYQALCYPLELDEEIMDTFVSGLVDLPAYYQKYLDISKPFRTREHIDDPAVAMQRNMAIEYPEFQGSQTSDFINVHQKTLDGALWKLLREKVIERSAKIDVWYNSPAEALFQSPSSKEIVGVQVYREGKLRNIKVKNGVVLATGGFENNKKMIQDYLGEPRLALYGTKYNKGIGIKMAIDVGADLWNMNKYEPGTGPTIKPQTGQRAEIPLTWNSFYSGSILIVGDDGTRYFKEDDHTRHGHIYNHGRWIVPKTHVLPYSIFDQKQFDKLNEDPTNPFGSLDNIVIKGDDLTDLCDKIKLDPEVLKQTIDDFNAFVEDGRDFQLGRSIESMEHIDLGSSMYAVPLQHTMLNTQGGPRRNSKAEVLDVEGVPIPKLYAAGELGHLSVNCYNGGQDISDDLIFGKIAGENAASAKESMGNIIFDVEETFSDFSSVNDVEKKDEYSLQKNQFIGESNQGIGNELSVRVTLDENQKVIEDVEILKQSETEHGTPAFEKLPKEMVKQNTYDVDIVSGASATSFALREAVKNALEQSTFNDQ